MNQMTKLFCGHLIPSKIYVTMYRAKSIRCPICGLQWRGTMVMDRDKGLPKRELREAARMGKMSPREFFKGNQGR